MQNLFTGRNVITHYFSILFVLIQIIHMSYYNYDYFSSQKIANRHGVNNT